MNLAGTLRHAVAHAVDGDTILLTGAVKTNGITLTQGELILTQQNLTIRSAARPNPVTISGGGNSRIFEVAGGASVTLSNLTIIGGDGQTGNLNDPHEGRGGGIVVDEGATLSITDSTVSDCFAPFVAGKGGLGGGIADYGTLTVSGCTVSDDQALGTYGGGIAVFSGAPFSEPFSATLTVSASIVCNNTAQQNGGGITGVSSTLTVSDTTLTGNSTVLYDGGGVNLHGGTLTMTGCTLSDNRAAEHGGGAFISTAVQGSLVIPATAAFSDCTVTGNSASSTSGGFSFGGGIDNAGTMTISSGTVSGNSASTPQGFGFGGGIMNFGTMTINNGCTLSGNTADISGGGIDNQGTLTISACTLSGNTAQYGGAILNISDLTIDHCTLTGNSAGDSGGAIYNFFFFGDTGVTISACTITHNTAVNFGGGIDNQSGPMTIENASVITGNTAPSGFGADVYNFDTLYLAARSIISILDGGPAIPI
jgi:hypothetical protein